MSSSRATLAVIAALVGRPSMEIAMLAAERRDRARRRDECAARVPPARADEAGGLTPALDYNSASTGPC